jgi:hypothetical protein
MWAIDPVRVIDETHQQPLSGNLGEQGQRSQTDQKAVGGIAR